MTTSPGQEESDSPRVPIQPGELIMRRFLSYKNHYKGKESPPLQEGAFHPRQGEDTGISLSRRRSDSFPHFLDEGALKAACTHPDASIRDNCGVCAFSSDAAQTIGLVVDLDPLPTDHGHVLLPQINYPALFGETSTLEDQATIRILIRQIITAVGDQILIAPKGK